MRRIDNPYLRVAIVWGAMLAIWLAVAQLRQLGFGAGYTLAGHVVSAIVTVILAVPAVVAARRWLDGGTLEGIGFELSPKAIRPFLVGALAFLLPSAIGFALVLGMGWASVLPTASWAEILLFVPVLMVLVFLFEALPEELAFRGYIYQALAERRSRLVAVVVQAVLFSLWGALLWIVVNGTVAVDRIVFFLAIGFVLGLVRVATGSVWAAIGLHTAFQTVAQLVLNVERGHFAVTDVGTLQFVALGIVPFSLAVVIVQRFYRDEPAWRQAEGVS